VATANIQDAAVTDAKIVSVSGSKVAGAVAWATNAASAASATNLANGIWSTAVITNQYGNLLLFLNNGSPILALSANGLAVPQGNLDAPNGINFGSTGGSLNSDGVGGLITSGGFGVDHALNVGGDLMVAGCIDGKFCQPSDRNLKDRFAPVDSRGILERVASLPITSWSYKKDEAIRHIGPMAQDFRAAFNLGADERHIETVDEGGIALAAIQGLNEKLREKDGELRALKSQNESLERRLADLERLVKSVAQQ